jgi:hypothetical protein
MTRGVASSLIARGGKKNEECRDFAGFKSMSLGLGPQRTCREVIPRSPATILGKALDIRSHGHKGRKERLAALDHIGVAEFHDYVGPVEDRRVIALVDAHHVADHLQRKRRCNLGNEISGAVRVVRDMAVTKRCALSPIASSVHDKTLGVNARLTIERNRWWRGPSTLIVD